ncbi:MAG: SH3 domain-containing protein [Chloroflexi bacterium]|nr:SH3 domain-containing protein [Chloroflexota bacterium]
MIDPSPGTDRRVFRIMGVVIAVVVIVTVTATAAVLLARRSGVDPLPAGSSSTPASIAVSLRRAVELRVGPAPDTAIVTRLPAGTSVNALGRSVDASWLVVSPTSATDVVGWVPADAVEGIRDASRLVVIADARNGGPPTPTAAQRPPDLPDLRIEAAASRSNRLVAAVVNDGPGDLPTPILIGVNDGAPVLIDTKAGEPLRAKERVEVVVPSEYVQRRARITLRVQTEPAEREAKTDNNSWTGIIEPDQPNNLGITQAFAAGDDQHLVVTVRNDSPIPVRGTLTLTVREPLPSTTLLGRDSREVTIEAGKTLDIPLPDLKRVDLTRISVRLSTDAIHDDVLADDIYPR